MRDGDGSPGVRARLALLGALFILAAGARLTSLDAPGILVDRDYTSATLARDLALQRSHTAPGWLREVAHDLRTRLPVLEPPVTEYLVSWIYEATGSERVGLARPLTASFWLLGGVFLYLAALRIVGGEGATLATAYYLFAPHGILLSRSFQPDALMMLGYLASLWSIVRAFDRQGRVRVLAPGIVAGVTALHRPLVLPALLAVFAALAWQQDGRARSVLERPALTFFALASLPALVYYGYAMSPFGFMGWKAEASFTPYLFFLRDYWTGWIHLAVAAPGPIALAAGAIGLVLARGPRLWAITLAAALGYGVLGLVFNVHIHTHGYYSAQIVPIVALCVGGLASTVARRLERAWGRRAVWTALAAAALGIAALGARDAREQLRAQRHASRLESRAVAREIGDLVGHSARVALVSRYYGLPLLYEGHMSGASWPRRFRYRLHLEPEGEPRSVERRLLDLDFAPEYFVITDFREYARHHEDLAEFLHERCRTVAASDQYEVYGGCRLPTAPAERRGGA